MQYFTSMHNLLYNMRVHVAAAGQPGSGNAGVMDQNYN